MDRSDLTAKIAVAREQARFIDAHGGPDARDVHRYRLAVRNLDDAERRLLDTELGFFWLGIRIIALAAAAVIGAVYTAKIAATGETVKAAVEHVVDVSKWIVTGGLVLLLYGMATGRRRAFVEDRSARRVAMVRSLRRRPMLEG
jgi:hypothetical protein